MKRTEGKITEVSRQEINEAIAANNHELVAEMLEGFDFVKDDTPPISKNHNILSRKAY